MKIDDRRQFTPDGELRQEAQSNEAPKPNTARDFSGYWAATGLVGIGLLFCVLLVVSLEQVPSSRAAPLPQPRPVLDALDAMTFCQIAVKLKLKAPASASFSGDSYREAVTETSPGRFRYRSHVDAQNSFGAILRTHFDCEVEDDGRGKPHLVSLDFSE